MSLTPIPTNINDGGASLDMLGAIVRELRGLTVNIAAGAAQGTAVPIAAIRQEDALVSVVRSVAGVLTDVTGNYSINDTHASGTLTAAAVAAGDTCVVDGVTFTARTAPVLATEFKIGVSDTATAANLAAVVNAYAKRWDGSKFHTATVVATSAAAVVTVKSVADGVAGNAIVLTGTPTRLAASGSGTLAGGTATGSVVSNADHSATSSLIVTWYNKQ